MYMRTHLGSKSLQLVRISVYTRLRAGLVTQGNHKHVLVMIISLTVVAVSMNVSVHTYIPTYVCTYYILMFV